MVGVILWPPATVITRSLPKSITCADLSGTVWRGQCSGLSVRGSRSGAIQWHIRAPDNSPAGLRVDLMWKKSESLAQGTLTLPLSGASSLRVGNSAVELQTLRNALPADLILGALVGVSGTLNTSNLLLEFESGRGAGLTGNIILYNARLLKSGASIGPFSGQFRGADGSLRDLGGALGLSATVKISDGAFRSLFRLVPRDASVLRGFSASTPLEAEVEGRL